MANSEDKRPKKVELGRVQVSKADAEIVHKARARVSGWLLKGGDEAETYLPVHLRAILTPGQFTDWAVTYANVRAGKDHSGWHVRVLKSEHRDVMLRERSVVLGDCRVSKLDADAFRIACLSFMQIYCPNEEDLTLNRFLTLSVVGFAECIRATSFLHILPLPPWAPRGHRLPNE
jgi:hypothetical protein